MFKNISTYTKLEHSNSCSGGHFGEKKRQLFFLFFFLIQISFAQPNNDKQVYDLNDPRNPECPCHKYQKMADDEYDKLQLKDQERLSDLSHSGFSKKERRKTIKWRTHKHKNLFTLKSHKIKRFKPCYSVCFKW